MASTRKSQAVVDWRRRAKARLVAAFGGSCGICGYSRCERNLHFHHLDPSEKSFSFGAVPTAGWDRLVEELRKCAMLCANCHGEVHDGSLAVPADIRRLDEAYAVYRTKKPKPAGAGRGRGSPGLARPGRRKVVRPSRAVLHRLLVKEKLPKTKVAERYKVSDSSIHIWARDCGVVRKRGTGVKP